MVDQDRAIPITVSIYQSQIKKIRDYKEAHKNTFGSEASLIQHIINEFFKEKNIKNDMVFHFLYPIILAALATFGTIMTTRLVRSVRSAGFVFQELNDLNTMFVIIGAMCIGLFIANMYWFHTKHKG